MQNRRGRWDGYICVGASNDFGSVPTQFNLCAFTGSDTWHVWICMQKLRHYLSWEVPLERGTIADVTHPRRRFPSQRSLSTDSCCSSYRWCEGVNHLGDFVIRWLSSGEEFRNMIVPYHRCLFTLCDWWPRMKHWSGSLAEINLGHTTARPPLLPNHCIVGPYFTKASSWR